MGKRTKILGGPEVVLPDAVRASQVDRGVELEPGDGAEGLVGIAQGVIDDRPLKDVLEVVRALGAQETIAAVVAATNGACGVCEEHSEVSCAVGLGVEVDAAILVRQPELDPDGVALITWRLVVPGDYVPLVVELDAEAVAEGRRFLEEGLKVEGLGAVGVDAEVVEVVVAWALS